MALSSALVVPETDLSRIRVYIDGFSMYHQCTRLCGIEHFNPRTYFDSDEVRDLLKIPRIDPARAYDGQLVDIQYFISGLDKSKGEKATRQIYNQSYLNRQPQTKVHIVGKVQRKSASITVRMNDQDIEFTGTLEREANTDMMIAAKMISDLYEGLSDRIILVTADGDFCPIIHELRSIARRLAEQGVPKPKISVLIPSGPAAMRKAKWNGPGNRRCLELFKLQESNVKVFRTPASPVPLCGIPDPPPLLAYPE